MASRQDFGKISARGANVSVERRRASHGPTVMVSCDVSETSPDQIRRQLDRDAPDGELAAVYAKVFNIVTSMGSDLDEPLRAVSRLCTGTWGR
jgi:hypothetical protein